jgi:hypothetical protein
MNFFTLYTIPPLLSSILFLILGASVYWNNRKSTINKTFLLVCFVTFWWQFSWFVLFNTQNEVLANYLVKIGYIGIIFIPIFFFHFFLVFVGESSRFDKILLYFSYSMGFIFEAALLTTNYFINGFYKYFWGFYPKASFLHPFYLLLLAILTVRALYLLFAYLKKKKVAHPTEYHQARYILLSLAFYIFASSDFIVNYGVEFYPLGFLFILLFLGTTAYAIVKHYLFGIKVILTELLVSIFSILLLIQILLSDSGWEYLWNIIIFIIFLFFGYLFIQSIFKEIRIKQRVGEASWRVLEQGEIVSENFKKVMSDKEKLIKQWFLSDVNKELEVNSLKSKIKELEEKYEKKE